MIINMNVFSLTNEIRGILNETRGRSDKLLNFGGKILAKRMGGGSYGTNNGSKRDTRFVNFLLALDFRSFVGVGNKTLLTEGTTMGSSLSIVMANIFMEYFEAKALNPWHLKPKFWFRFSNDTFVIWKHRRLTLDSFLSHLNSISPHI